MRSAIVLAVAAWLATVLACQAPAQAQTRPMSVEDMLKVEGTGTALADRDGRWFFYERLRPYDELGDFSFRTYAMRKTGHQIWRYDLKSEGEAELLPGLDPDPSTYLLGLSPSGRYLTLMNYHFGDLGLSAYDVEAETAAEFGHIPAFSRTGAHTPVWVSQDELVLAALPEGHPPMETSARTHTGKALVEAWWSAWRGDSVTASELRTRPVDSSGEQEAGYLVRLNARTGGSERLAEGLYADLRLSPDGRYLAGLAVSKPRPPDPDELVQNGLRRHTLVVIDLSDGAVRSHATGLEFFPYTIAWSPDSRRLAAFGWENGKDQRDGRFQVIDIRSGTVTPYDHRGLQLASERERGWLQRPERTVFLGDGLAVYARPIPEGEDQDAGFAFQDIAPPGLPRADWYGLSADGRSKNLTGALEGVSGIPVHAAGTHMTVAADDGVYRIRTDGGRTILTPGLRGQFTHLLPGTFTTHSSVARPEFTSAAMFRVEDGARTSIATIDLTEGHEGEYVLVDAPGAYVEPMAASLEAGSVLYRADDGAAARLLVANDANRPREIASLNAHLSDVDLGRWKIITYDIEDPENLLPPQTVESCVLLPPGYSGEKPLPLIVEVYPDLGPSCKDPGRRRITYPDPYSWYLWTGRGYAYTRLTLPRALIRTEDGPIAGMDEAVEAGVDALVEQGIADPARLTIHGYSQGGISALYVAAKTDIFSAVIAMNSWTDLVSHYFGGAGVYSYVYGENLGTTAARYDAVKGSDFGIGRTPFEDPEIYYRNSPVFLAPSISAPVMLIHSDMDGFDMSQFDEMFGALMRTGKDARYVRYWGEGHGPSSPANIRDMWERIGAFLEEQGAAPSSGE